MIEVNGYQNLHVKEASEVVEYIYNDFANVSQRNSMEEEFYGPAYALHKVTNKIASSDLCE